MQKARAVKLKSRDGEIEMSASNNEKGGGSDEGTIYAGLDCHDLSGGAELRRDQGRAEKNVCAYITIGCRFYVDVWSMPRDAVQQLADSVHPSKSVEPAVTSVNSHRNEVE